MTGRSNMSFLLSSRSFWGVCVCSASWGDPDGAGALRGDKAPFCECSAAGPSLAPDEDA